MLLANFPGAAAWDAGGRVDGNWDDAVKVKDAPDAVYNFSASGGNATENFRISLVTEKLWVLQLVLITKVLVVLLTIRKKLEKLI